MYFIRMYGGRKNGKYSSDFLVTATYSLGETKKPAWCGLCPGTRTTPRSGGSFRSLPGVPIHDFHLLFRGLLANTTVRVTHGPSHRGCLHSPPATPMLWEHRLMGKGNIVAQASNLPQYQFPYKQCGKMTPQKLLEEGKLGAPGTEGGSGQKLIGRYHINIG